MFLLLERIARKDNYTIGKLSIDGVPECDVLEDTDRYLTDKMREEDIMRLKVKARTAIPTGDYDISLTMSQRFKRVLPLLENVKGFSGIRIHSGNTSEDTEGCLLVGKNKIVGKLIDSRITFDALFAKLEKAYKRGERIMIKIC